MVKPMEEKKDILFKRLSLKADISTKNLEA